MKTYLSDIIPKIQKFSEKLDNITLLTNQHWVLVEEIDNFKTVYIFRTGNELIISRNGKVEKANWEYLGLKSLLIDLKDDSYLFKHGFFDENILALKIDGKDEFAFFVNETRFDKELNSFDQIVDFLTQKYLNNEIFKNEITGRLERKEEKLYKAPDFKIVSRKEDYSLFRGKFTTIEVEYSDGKKGVVYLRPKNGQAYFKQEYNNRWYSVTHYYLNLDYCITALHHYLKTGKRLNDGYLITYS